MEATLIEGVRSSNPIIKAIAVKALHYLDLSTVPTAIDSYFIQQKAKHKYDALIELWNELAYDDTL